MVDQLGSMERVANTPIPKSCMFYSSHLKKPTKRRVDGIHLKQCITLYLFALPFTLVNDLGWITIPAVTLVAFTLMGIEGIADEIEMPFGMKTISSSYSSRLHYLTGHDKSDLPLGV